MEKILVEKCINFVFTSQKDERVYSFCFTSDDSNLVTFTTSNNVVTIPKDDFFSIIKILRNINFPYDDKVIYGKE